MKLNQSSLGISPRSNHGSFVFGGKSSAVGITLNLATNLHQPESIAHQYLDFVQKLYAEQSYIGEYFEHIHIGSVGSQVSKGSLRRAEESVVLLKELLIRWIEDNSLDVQLHSHSAIELIAQKKFLSFRDGSSGKSASDFTGIDDAFALWSLAFSETSSVNQANTLRTFKAISYEEISGDVAAQELSQYKIETIVRFGSTQFVHEGAERQRLYLLQLAENSQSTKYELLGCRERLLEILEKHSISKVRNPASSTISGRIVQPQMKQSVVGAREAAVVDVNLSEYINPAAETINRNKNSLNQNPQQLAAGNSETVGGVSKEFFASPKYAVPERGEVDIPNGKFWKEATATPMRVDAWLFRFVVVIALVGVFYLYRSNIL